MRTKYAVVTEDNKKYAADSKAPLCSECTEICYRDGNVWACPNHGTKYFEEPLTRDAKNDTKE